MAWRKNIRNLFGGDSQQSINTARPEFFESKELSLLEAGTLEAIRNQSTKHEQNKLLIKKLKLCSIICDFRLGQELNDMEEKKKIFNKTSMLHEICTYLKTAQEWNSLEVVTNIFECIVSNLFRPIPDSYHNQHLMGVDHFVPITYTLPSWQHLEIIYEILTLTFSNKSINQLLITEYIKKYSFINNFVHLLNSLDKNERNHIQSVLETFYNEHGNLFEKELILHLVNYCLDFIHYEIGSAHGIKSILNVFNSMSLIDTEIFIKVLMPLHKMDYKHFRTYEFVLWIYCKRIIEEDEHLSVILFKNLLQYWPITNAFKEQQYLKKIAIILDFIDEDIWENVTENNQPQQWKLFKSVAYKILYCLQNAYHYKTICDILDIIETEEVQEFIDKFGGKDLWCKLYQALYDIVNYFFYFETVNKCKETMEIMREQDDLPMQYVDVFTKIDSGKTRMYPLSLTPFKDNKNKTSSYKDKQKQLQRKKKYEKMTKKAHSTSLYKKVKKQKEKEERQRIEREKKEKKERERREKEERIAEEKRRQKREREMKAASKSAPKLPNHEAPHAPNDGAPFGPTSQQLSSIPPPPPTKPFKKSDGVYTRHRSNHISNGHILTDEYVESPPPSPKDSAITKTNSMPPMRAFNSAPSSSQAANNNNNNNNNNDNNKENKQSGSPYFQRYMKLQQQKNAKATNNNVVYKNNNNNNNNNNGNKSVNSLKAKFENNGNKKTSTNYQITPKNAINNNKRMKFHNSDSLASIPPPPPQTEQKSNLPNSNPTTMMKKSASASSVFDKKNNTSNNNHNNTSNNKSNDVNVNTNRVISPKRGKGFWPGSRGANTNNKTENDKIAEKERARQQKQKEKEDKQREKEEKQRQKALEKAEKQRQKDREKKEKQKQKELEKERKREEKRKKKEAKRLEKQMKKGRGKRPRRSIDIDRRSSSISNPVPPKRDSAGYNRYNQITQNNQNNHYLNTQYYYGPPNGNVYSIPNRNTNTQISTGKDKRKTTDYDKSPTLAFSYSPSATYDPPKVSPYNNNNNNIKNGYNNNHMNRNANYNNNINNSPFGRAPGNKPRHIAMPNKPHHTKAKSHNQIRTKTPPPPQKRLPANNNNNNRNNYNSNNKNKLNLAPAQPLGQNHPLRKNKFGKKAHSMNNIPTNKIKPPPHSGTNKKLPPRPWPPEKK